ncbi:MAG: HAMP domain-containing protein [Hydrogenophaga sp.]|uniref:ATP-binding protein n=1 Tax=Hydrogenophaga sp. TaxID=1904254 RepID=UPI00257E588C|nr:ATP-binding protein [Hydrogenophaga sp.]MBL0944717.1 HAMP domain-containing protein [Hydrogenophaga sp.]
MRLSLTARLFTAVLSTAIAVAFAMGVFTHVNLNRDFLGFLNEQEINRLDQATLSAALAYRENGNSWDFTRLQTHLGGYLLRRGVPTEQAEALKLSPAELMGATRRMTLLDAQRRRVFGYPNPSTDAIERPIEVDGLTVGWMLLTPIDSVSSGAEKRFADAQRRSAWLVGGAATLLAAAVAFWVSRRLLRPVRQVAEATHRLAAGDYAARVPVDDRADREADEVSRLGHDFNHLALTLQRNEAARREFMADVSHELRTPLGVLNGELEALQDGVRTLDAQALRSLKGEVATLHKLVDDLYDLSLADVGALSYRKAELDLRELLADVAAAFGERLQGRSLRLALELPVTPLPLFGDAGRLQQLFANLLENSCRYTDEGGAVRLAARTEGRQLVVDVQDSAPGVPAEQLPRLFERFFRAEPSRSRASGGAGLGLSICQRIVQAHDGTIEARPSPLGGLWLRVALPLP